jgi:methylated-DNA-[protein]-cysteine S-methyltransferase
MSDVREPWAAKMATPFALLGIRTDAGAVTRVAYLIDNTEELSPQDAVAARAVREVERYLDDPEYRFGVTLAPGGTRFQQRVWDAIRAIPCGEARTYGEIARKCVTGARAVGQACGANRIALIIPCHRVVASGGALGGFMNARESDGGSIKRWLLAHERRRYGA